MNDFTKQKSSFVDINILMVLPVSLWHKTLNTYMYIYSKYHNKILLLVVSADSNFLKKYEHVTKTCILLPYIFGKKVQSSNKFSYITYIPARSPCRNFKVLPRGSTLVSCRVTMDTWEGVGKNTYMYIL